jgi:hypothetical protein
VGPPEYQALASKNRKCFFLPKLQDAQDWPVVRGVGFCYNLMGNDFEPALWFEGNVVNSPVRLQLGEGGVAGVTGALEGAIQDFDGFTNGLGVEITR